MGRLAIITGASSGIGASLAATAPTDVDGLLGISRRPPSVGGHHAADLADPASWPQAAQRIERALQDRPSAAVLLHFAGVMEPTGPADALAPDALERALTLNAVAGPLLASGFLRACADLDVHATVVLCSSPAASAVRTGIAHYCAGKAALETWARVVAEEQRGRPEPARVVTVVPWGVDTPMVRSAMAAGDDVPLAAAFRTRAAGGELADPDDTAREIWAFVDADPPTGAVAVVGAVPG
jgi:benzil reductase ((S)-benzoin forming)